MPLNSMIKRGVLFTGLCLGLTGISVGQTQMTDYVVGAGATETSNNTMRMVGTFGQPLVGLVGNNAQGHSAGFWAKVSAGTLTSVERLEDPSVPAEFRLHENYPNPFNPSTTIRFDLPRQSVVSLVVYDMLGKVVSILVDGEMQPGQYRATWDASDQYGRTVSSGTYLYRIESEHYSDTGVMTLLK